MEPLLHHTNPSVLTVDQALAQVAGPTFSTRLWFLTGMTQFADAMELLLISFLAAEIRCPFELQVYDITLLQTCVLLGMWMGSNGTGILSDTFGRRPSVILSLICTVAGGLTSTFAFNFTTILVSRFVVGLGVGSAGVALTLFTEFQQEKEETETRGRTLVVFFTFFSVGALFEALVAWTTLSTVWRWRALLLVSVLPSVVLLLITPCWLPESPRWLVAKGNSTRALHILRNVSRINHQKDVLSSVTALVGTSTTHKNTAAAADEATDAVESNNTGLVGSDNEDEDMPSKPMQKTTVALSVLFFLMASLYYSIVLVGSAIVNPHPSGNSSSGVENTTCSNHDPPTHSTGEFLSLVFTNGAELPGLLVAYLLLDRIGRQQTIQFFFGTCGVCCVALLLSTLSSQPSPLWVTTTIVFGARASALGFNQSLWIYTALFYPTTSRARGLGWTTSCARVGSLLAPVIVNVGGDLSLVAGCCIGLSLVSWLVVHQCLEKDGKSERFAGGGGGGR